MFNPTRPSKAAWPSWRQVVDLCCCRFYSNIVSVYICVPTYLRVYCLYGFQGSIRDAEHTRMFQRITAHCQRRRVCDTWHNQGSLGNDAHVQSRAHTYEGLNLRDLRLCWLPIMCAVCDTDSLEYTLQALELSRALRALEPLLTTLSFFSFDHENIKTLVIEWRLVEVTRVRGWFAIMCLLHQ